MTNSADGIVEAVLQHGSTNCMVMLDIDETLLDPLSKWQQELSLGLGVQFTVEDIKMVGGVDPLFQSTPQYSEFVELANKLRGSHHFNSNLPTIDGALPGVTAIRSMPDVSILAYLTTRPEKVIAATAANLKEHGFPERLIIARPRIVKREDTAEWKLSIINRIANQVSGWLVMIDDSPALSMAIRHENARSLKARKLVSILFDGPLTRANSTPETSDSVPKEHFYVASWKNIPAICQLYANGQKD